MLPKPEKQCAELSEHTKPQDMAHEGFLSLMMGSEPKALLQNAQIHSTCNFAINSLPSTLKCHPLSRQLLDFCLFVKQEWLSKE